MSIDRKKALFAGTFDPVTLGHEEVVRIAAAAFDEVCVAVAVNASKSPLFTAEERLDMCRRVFADLSNVKVVCGDGLLSDIALACGCGTVLKGLRNTEDFVYEFEHAQIYRGMTPPLETVFIPARGEYIHVSSTAVKAIAQLGGDVAAYVSGQILEDVYNKFR